MYFSERWIQILKEVLVRINKVEDCGHLWLPWSLCTKSCLFWLPGIRLTQYLSSLTQFFLVDLCSSIPWLSSHLTLHSIGDFTILQVNICGQLSLPTSRHIYVQQPAGTQDSSSPLVNANTHLFTQQLLPACRVPGHVLSQEDKIKLPIYWEEKL